MSDETFAPHLPREAWEAWLADRLDGPARSRVEAHLAECAECTAWVARTDPSHLFHGLRRPMPEPAWDGFWEVIQRDLRPAPRRLRPATFAAGIAAALTLTALVAVMARVPRQDGLAGGVALEPADPCAQATLAALNLTRPMTLEECRLLHGGMAVDETPVVIVSASIDLRGL